VIRIRHVIFDDNTEYNSFEIDLMQVVNELMLEITYEAQNLNSIINIVEEFSDEDVSKHAFEHIYSSTEDIADQADQMNKQSKIDESKNKKVEYLSSLSSFERFTTESSNSSASVTTVKIKSKKMINLDLDTINILCERMRRRRKQIYSIALTQMIESELTSYHIVGRKMLSEDLDLLQQDRWQYIYRSHKAEGRARLLAVL
jgi:hypothetical protein